MLTLGINATFHDCAAALVKDGMVLAAVEEERFTRIKHGKQPVPFSTWQLPYYAIDYCLSQRPHTRAGAIWPSISRCGQSGVAGEPCCAGPKASDALSAQAHRRSASRHLTS